MYLWVLYKDPVIERMGLKIYVLDIRLGLSLKLKFAVICPWFSVLCYSDLIVGFACVVYQK